jgi:hypothetical protein
MLCLGEIKAIKSNEERKGSFSKKTSTEANKQMKRQAKDRLEIETGSKGTQSRTKTQTDRNATNFSKGSISRKHLRPTFIAAKSQNLTSESYPPARR